MAVTSGNISIGRGVLISRRGWSWRQHVCIAPLPENSPLNRSKWHVLTRDHIVLPATQCPHVYPRIEWAILPSLHSRRASPHFGRYSFFVPQKVEGWVGRAGRLHTEVVCRLKTVTHPSTNRPIVRRTGIELTTVELDVRRPNHRTTESPVGDTQSHGSVDRSDDCVLCRMIRREMLMLMMTPFNSPRRTSTSICDRVISFIMI